MNDDDISDDEIRHTMRSFKRSVIVHESMLRMTRYMLGAAVTAFVAVAGYTGFEAGVIIVTCGAVYTALNAWHDARQLSSEMKGG